MIDPGCSSSVRIHVVHELLANLLPMEAGNAEQRWVNNFLKSLPHKRDLLFCVCGKITHEKVLQEQGVSPTHPHLAGVSAGPMQMELAEQTTQGTPMGGSHSL